MAEEKELLKCNKCGEENTEVKVFDFKAVDMTDTIASVATFGVLEIKVCQKCISEMFRSCVKDS